MNFISTDVQVARYNEAMIACLNKAVPSIGPKNERSSLPPFDVSKIHTMGVQKDGRLYVVLKSDSIFIRFFARLSVFFGRLDARAEIIRSLIVTTDIVIKSAKEQFTAKVLDPQTHAKAEEIKAKEAAAAEEAKLIIAEQEKEDAKLHNRVFKFVNSYLPSFVTAGEEEEEVDHDGVIYF